MKSIAVFCASSPGNKAVYRDAAASLGREIAHRKWRLIYGGGVVGLMGIIADAALAAGGEVIGVLPQTLVNKEVGHTGLTELLIVNTMHERKAAIAERADAFVALPGGFGTYDELCEMLTWSQLEIHRKPCALLNVEGFYDPLLAQFDRAVADELIKPENRAKMLASSNVTDLLNLL